MNIFSELTVAVEKHYFMETEFKVHNTVLCFLVVSFINMHGSPQEAHKCTKE